MNTIVRQTCAFVLLGALPGQAAPPQRGSAVKHDHESAVTMTMPLGVDAAGSKTAIFTDPAMADAFEQMGFDFLMTHIYRSSGPGTKSGMDHIAGMNRWAAKTGHGYVVNLENTVRPRGEHPEFRRPGFFFQPEADWLAKCLESPHFRGVCYDEAEHWITNGVDITGGVGAHENFRPHFFDAEGTTLEEAYSGNLNNLIVLRTKLFEFAAASSSGLDQPLICSEHVFPTLFPLFARAGVAPYPKLLKESVLPVVAAVTLGACRQYGVPYVPCLDLWGPRAPRGSRAEWPYHTPEELRSALLFSYWTGAHSAYIENINYKDSLYRSVGGQAELTEWGRIARDFTHEYMPRHARTVLAQDFRPEIVIVRFPDSDWGQVKRHHIRQNLYGAGNLTPNDVTRAWQRIWRVICHGTLPGTGLTWHAGGFSIPYRLFFPANSVAVYDHLADKPTLYEGVRLVFLLGVHIPPATLAAVQAFAQAGGTVATVPRLAPKVITADYTGGTSVVADGQGKWILFERADDPVLQSELSAYLGAPDELRFTFRNSEVVFTAPTGHANLEVQTRERH
ncbi:MAG: hypothetical protein HOJ57_28205 [Lentisphaerae bacterium]|nr:hypothetical protein [Lentisphaerota bacterium]MBT5609854.1 hypothetical protein [Lentisphaerota bacterium]MBT7056517.1 hypothetical protein [Lentisphaerota bacterium]